MPTHSKNKGHTTTSHMRKATIIMFALVMSTCSRPPTVLQEVVNSGQLRVMTRNSPTTFYEGAVGFDGPEYQLITGFAAFLEEKYQRTIEVIFTTSDQFPDLIPAVTRGRVHIAAAGLTVTHERAAEVSFGPSYQTVSQQLIYRLNTAKPGDIDDLGDKHLEIMAGSSYVDTLQDIQQLLPDLRWTENSDAEISELLVAVDEQKLDFTVADSNEFAVHRLYMPDLRVARDLKTNDQLAWAFGRYRTGALQSDAQEYFKIIRENGTLEQILDRFYGHTNRFDYVGTQWFIRDYEALMGSYRDAFRAAGQASSIDWRLLAAIGYQESHWDPSAVSSTGVRGLMQLTKITADSIGVENREDPVEAIQGGARYFAYLWDRLDEIAEPDRTWFALAAYNVGYGHLEDARVLTERNGGNPDRWLDVKESMPLLAIRKYYSTLPHGYARGWEPVQYVSNIRIYFEILNWLDEEDNPAIESLQVPQTEQQTATKTSFITWL
jgi:membrane-bound lytic murein transglycosylase F